MKAIAYGLVDGRRSESVVIPRDVMAEINRAGWR
jgi:hypothetical protein